MQTETVSPQVTERKTKEKQKMHLYVLTCVGVLLAFAATFPVAYWRVSQSNKYNGTPFKSLSLEESQKPAP